MARHLEPVAGELAILGLADTRLPAAQREEAGYELWRLGQVGAWQPGQMEIRPIEPPDLVADDTFWQVHYFTINNSAPAPAEIALQRPHLPAPRPPPLDSRGP